MGICVVPALLVVISLSSSAATRGVLPVFLQLQPALKGYGDSPQPSPISRLHMSEGASAKFLLKKVEPEYPQEAKVAGVEGDVVFRIVIGSDGRIEEIHLRRGIPVLIEAAAKALSKWQYGPCMFDGNAVEIETLATIRFRGPSNSRLGRHFRGTRTFALPLAKRVWEDGGKYMVILKRTDGEWKMAYLIVNSDLPPKMPAGAAGRH